jgi:Prophage minor tail protein Z (GPZ)
MQGLTVHVRDNANLVAMELIAAAQDMRNVALVRALNKTADQVKVAASREVRSAGYNLKASTIKQALKVRHASQGNLTATVVATGRPIPLIQYAARQTAKGVTVSVKKGRKLVAGAFIATMPGGHRGVFVREPGGHHKKVRRGAKTGWHQLPIRELFGPSVPDGLASQAVQAALQRFIATKFPVILQHEQTWLRRKSAAPMPSAP